MAGHAAPAGTALNSGDSTMIARLRSPVLHGITVLAAITALLAATPAHADTTAYLVNVTVRPGYHFPDAEAALAYGYGICDKIADHTAYTQLIHEVAADFGTSDEYQAAYLITQAANELCPQWIWQLRNSAAHYQPTGG